MKYLATLIILSLMATFNISMAQDLKNQLKGKHTLSEIMTAVDDYYVGKDEHWRGPNGNLPRLKHWKRWEWYMSSRLGPNREFVDIRKRVTEAKREVDRLQERASSRGLNPYWTSIGPASVNGAGIGRADRIAFHPTDPDIFYVGTPAGGLWRTTNGGSTWSPLTDHIPSLGISGIVVNWQDPNDIYILTGDGDSDLLGGLVDQFNYERKSIGVLKSTDNGNTWVATADLDTNSYLAMKMVQNPTDHLQLLVATTIGVYHTNNGGNSWTQVRSGQFWDVEYKPGSNWAYAAGDDEIIVSDDGGLTWLVANVTTPYDEPERIEIEVTPAHWARLYMLVCDTVTTAGQYAGTYRSLNNGLTLDQRGNTPNILGRSNTGADADQQAKYDHCMAVSPNDANIVITGGIRIWKSTDGGQTYNIAHTDVHDDVHDLAYNPLDGKLYACTDGGVLVSSNDGDSWTKLYTGFETSQLYQMTGTPHNNDYLLGGFQDNGVKLRNDGTTAWDQIAGADGYGVEFYHHTETRFYASMNSSAFRYSNSGATKKNISVPGNTRFFGTLAAHQSNSDSVFIAYHDVYASGNQGDTWVNKGATGKWAMEPCPTNSRRLYAAGPASANNSDARMFRTDNLGDSWISLHNKPEFPDPEVISKITDIAVDPSEDDRVYFTVGGFDDGMKVYRSIDAGENWENYSGSLPNVPVNAVAVKEGGLSIFIGTDVGVFYRNNSMNGWMPINNWLPNAPVTDLYINSNTNKIYASTFGRGVWVADVPTFCEENLSISGQRKGQYLYQANNAVTATIDVRGGIGTNVNIKAGERVRLTPGFVARRFTNFRAFIDVCGSAWLPD